MVSLNTVRKGSDHRVYEVASGGSLMVTRRAGRGVRGELEELLEGLPEGGVLYVDTRGVDFLDYSFADEVLGVLLSRMSGGEHAGRHVVLVEEDRDLLENIEASLRQRSLAVLRVENVGEGPRVVGEIPDHLKETLDAVHEVVIISNADLAAKLGINHTACNNRGTKLFKLGLIHRSARTDAPGGRQYTYERIP